MQPTGIHGPALVLAEAVAEAVRVKAELDAAIDTASKTKEGGK